MTARDDGSCVLIADDAPLARRKLRHLLAAVEWVEEIVEASDGPTAIRAIDEHRPDLVFLDIRMPGATGIEVLEQTAHRPHVIFTTAFDRYAVTAFELHAIDYLLKPFGPERFHDAIERARAVLEATGRPDDEVEEEVASGSDRLAAISSSALEGRARQALSPGRPLRHLFVRHGGRIVPLAVEDIEWLEARGDYVRMHLADRSYLVHVPLKDFEARLDPERFIRVHRSHIVNLEHVEVLAPHDSSRLQIHLRSGATVVASRARSKQLRRFVI